MRTGGEERRFLPITARADILWQLLPHGWRGFCGRLLPVVIFLDRLVVIPLAVQQIPVRLVKIERLILIVKEIRRFNIKSAARANLCIGRELLSAVRAFDPVAEGGFFGRGFL
ncbi:hypothetical protein SDC9_188553 [bioreactor metagenome]|uniref:Uncharacterized protein n=1 Tax=bioreactor metagenome TaxID=1076179 RepID=A0A645I0F2_9ZZZZ